MPARRLDNRNSLRRNMIPKICGRSDAILQIIFFKRLLQSNSNGFQITPGQSTVSRIPLGQNQQIFFLLRQQVVIGAKKTANIRHAIFLGRHGAAVAVAEHFLRNLLGRFGFVSRLTQLDEVGIFGEAASIEIKRDFMFAANRANLPDIFHRNRLAASGIIGDGEHDQRNTIAADARRSALPAPSHPCCP